MNKLIAFRRVKISCLSLATVFTSFVQMPLMFAQDDAMHAASSESIKLQVGDIFEILPVHDIVDATYTWILTQDRTFLEASRAPSFRKRLIQPGQYTLYAEIASPDGSRRMTRTMVLDYSARQPGQAEGNAVTAGSGVLVRTEPASDDKGRIVMLAGNQLVQLIPVNPDVVPLALDIDLARDADGDGKPDNDIQTDDTFFHSDATPIYVWITDEPLTTHSISVTAAGADGARTQKIDIINEDIARAQGIVQSPVRIENVQTAERTFTFTAVFDNPAAAAGQLLYQWQFGDGQQSLVTKPDHTYAEDGPYTISLLIRNLRDGSEVATTSISLNVSPANPSSVSSEISSETVAPTPTPSTSSGLGIGSIILMAAIFLGSILLGIGLIVLVGKLRGNKTTLADKLESMEKTIVKSPTDQAAPLIIAPPATVVTKRQEPPAFVAEREKELDAERPAAEPTPKQETTPSWLVNGGSKPAVSVPTPAPSAPAAPTAPAPQVPKPAAAPVQTPKQTPTPASPTPKQTPAWLQQPATPQAPKPSAPTPTPQQPKPATPSLVTPKPTAATPAWLQQPVAPAPAQNPNVTPPVVPQPQTPKLVAPIQPATPPVQTAPTPIVTPVPQATAFVQPVTPPAPMLVPTPRPTPAPAQPVVLQPVIQAPMPSPVNSAPIIAVQQATISVTPPAPLPAAPAAQIPVQPTPLAPATPQQMEMERSNDQPIAIIRAESLNPPEAQNG